MDDQEQLDRARVIEQFCDERIERAVIELQARYLADRMLYSNGCPILSEESANG